MGHLGKDRGQGNVFKKKTYIVLFLKRLCILKIDPMPNGGGFNILLFTFKLTLLASFLS